MSRMKLGSMVNILLSKNEFKYLKNFVSTEYIRYGSVSGVARKNETVKENSKIVDSLKEKLSNAESSNSYSL